MPNRFTLAGCANGEENGEESGDSDVWAPSPTKKKKQRRLSSLRNNFGSFWRRLPDQRDVEAGLIQTPNGVVGVPVAPPLSEVRPQCTRRSSVPASCPHRRAIPSLPRPQTFRRQESEKRENLLEVPPSPTERRTVSVDRQRGCRFNDWRRTSSPQPISNVPSASAPNVDTASQDQESSKPVNSGTESGQANNGGGDATKQQQQQTNGVPNLPPLQIPDRNLDDFQSQNSIDRDDDTGIDLKQLEEEYDRRWILNLSMHFRDKSNREKFFVTYAATPSTWRRLTISLDYRKAPEGSLEADLMTLHYQRDKSFRIYEAIHESLPEIQYYNTVTNLRLETTADDGQLHVHVREDANEIVQFPSCDLFQHVQVPKYCESEAEFLSHISGFVYKVRVEGQVMIKKEIPGPDTIDEFLYEVNALDALLHSRHVIDLEGLVTDDEGLVVKGLLISYAEKGSLVDMLYDYHRNPSDLAWHRREKWAKQIVAGLSDIHEAGFVQGDFTLSNIVIDEDDNAAIIDINRRGCPVGWEPPELGRLIDSGQRISMCIGVKTDIYQLGMVLWAIAEVNDEPERADRPLPQLPDDFPPYYQRLTSWCLSERPQERPAAKRLLRHFPLSAGRTPSSTGGRSVDFADDAIRISDNSISTHRSDKEYIDPKMAITLDDVNQRPLHRPNRDQPPDTERDGSLSPFTSAQVTYFTPRSLRSSAPADPDLETDPLVSNAPSTSYRFDSSGSWVVGHHREHAFRGRSPVSFGRGRRRSSPFARSPSLSSATSLSPGSPPARRVRGRVCDSEDEEGKVEGREEAVAAMVRAAELLHADSGFDERVEEDFGGVGNGEMMTGEEGERGFDGSDHPPALEEPMEPPALEEVTAEECFAAVKELPLAPEASAPEEFTAAERFPTPEDLLTAPERTPSPAPREKDQPDQSDLVQHPPPVAPDMVQPDKSTTRIIPPAPPDMVQPDKSATPVTPPNPSSQEEQHSVQTPDPANLPSKGDFALDTTSQQIPDDEDELPPPPSTTTTTMTTSLTSDETHPTQQSND